MGQDEGLIIRILSAEFGLIPANKPIHNYDRRMTAERADDLRPLVAAAMYKVVGRYQPAEIFICAGKTYLRALDGLAEKGLPVLTARGGQGGKLAALKAWLHKR
jgi:hypothetical protein